MTLILVFFSLAVLPGILNACLVAPVKDLPQPCSIKNLTIVSSINGRILANQTACNASVPQNLLTNYPLVNFIFFDLKQYKNSSFILFAYDVTIGKLLWAVSNLTSSDAALISSPPGRLSVLKHYQAVQVQPSRKYHDIVFVVFEEKPNFLNSSVILNQRDVESFNLLAWLSQQIYSGSKICGPVAATRLAVYDSHYFISPPSPSYPQFQPQPGPFYPPPFSQSSQNFSSPINNNHYRPTVPSSFSDHKYKNKRNGGISLKQSLVTFILPVFSIMLFLNLEKDFW